MIARKLRFPDHVGAEMATEQVKLIQDILDDPAKSVVVIAVPIGWLPSKRATFAQFVTQLREEVDELP